MQRVAKGAPISQIPAKAQVVTLAGDIIRSKALDLLVENADIEDEAAEPPSEASTDTKEQSP